MKHLFALLLSVAALLSAKAQEVVSTITLPAEQPETSRVYAELLGYGTNLLGLNKNVTVTVDLGQFQSAFKPYALMNEDGKVIKFNSMVAAMNYMGERGWKFVQAYVITESGKNHVYHWLMYKDVSDPAQIYEGLYVQNTHTEPQKKKSKDESNQKHADPVFGD